MQHPDEGLIHAWLDGELDAAEAARVEALVSSDPAWAAAAAEARGLIAATARIVGALDHVPANVIPGAQPSRSATRQWMWRAAAALVLVAGSAVVLERQSPELPVPGAKTEATTAPAAVAPAPKTGRREAAGAARPPESRSDLRREELDNVKNKTESTRDKDALAAAADARANTAGAINQATAAPSAAGGAAAPGAPYVQRAAAAEKKAYMTLSCFEQREPPDSAKRILRLDAGALADSVRLEKLTVRGDTIAAVNGRLTAVRVRCPEP